MPESCIGGLCHSRVPSVPRAPFSLCSLERGRWREGARATAEDRGGPDRLKLELRAPEPRAGTSWRLAGNRHHSLLPPGTAAFGHQMGTLTSRGESPPPLTSAPLPLPCSSSMPSSLSISFHHFLPFPLSLSFPFFFFIPFLLLFLFVCLFISKPSDCSRDNGC